MFLHTGVLQNGVPVFSAQALSCCRFHVSSIAGIGYGSDRVSSA